MKRLKKCGVCSNINCRRGPTGSQRLVRRNPSTDSRNGFVTSGRDDLQCHCWRWAPGNYLREGTFSKEQLSLGDDRVPTSIISPAELKMWHGFSLWRLSSLFADGTDGNA